MRSLETMFNDHLNNSLSMGVHLGMAVFVVAALAITLACLLLTPILMWTPLSDGHRRACATAHRIVEAISLAYSET